MEIIKSRKEKDAIILAVKGRLDSVAAQEFGNQIDDLINQGETRIIFDLSELDYISSAGLRSILVIAKELEERNGKIVLSAVKPSVMKVFEISGLTAILPITKSVETALAQM